MSVCLRLSVKYCMFYCTCRAKCFSAEKDVKKNAWSTILNCVRNLYAYLIGHDFCPESDHFEATTTGDPSLNKPTYVHRTSNTSELLTWDMMSSRNNSDTGLTAPARVISIASSDCATKEKTSEKFATDQVNSLDEVHSPKSGGQSLTLFSSHPKREDRSKGRGSQFTIAFHLLLKKLSILFYLLSEIGNSSAFPFNSTAVDTNLLLSAQCFSGADVTNITGVGSTSPPTMHRTEAYTGNNWTSVDSPVGPFVIALFETSCSFPLFYIIGGFLLLLFVWFFKFHSNEVREHDNGDDDGDDDGNGDEDGDDDDDDDNDDYRASPQWLAPQVQEGISHSVVQTNIVTVKQEQWPTDPLSELYFVKSQGYAMSSYSQIVFGFLPPRPIQVNSLIAATHFPYLMSPSVILANRYSLEEAEEICFPSPEIASERPQHQPTQHAHSHTGDDRTHQISPEVLESYSLPSYSPTWTSSDLLDSDPVAQTKVMMSVADVHPILVEPDRREGRNNPSTLSSLLICTPANMVIREDLQEGSGYVQQKVPEHEAESTSSSLSEESVDDMNNRLLHSQEEDLEWPCDPPSNPGSALLHYHQPHCQVSHTGHNSHSAIIALVVRRKQISVNLQCLPTPQAPLQPLACEGAIHSADSDSNPPIASCPLPRAVHTHAGSEIGVSVCLGDAVAVKGHNCNLEQQTIQDPLEFLSLSAGADSTHSAILSEVNGQELSDLPLLVENSKSSPPARLLYEPCCFDQDLGVFINQRGEET